MNILAAIVLFSVTSCISGGYVNEKYINYVFYSRTNLNGIRITNDDATDAALISEVFDTSLPTIILIHGWKDNYEADSNAYIREAILNHENANVIKIDWSKYANLLYLLAKNCVPEVGEITGKFIETVVKELNYSYDNVTVVGFSLGAHVAGNVGRYTNGLISLIIGLDPAGPLISASKTDYILDATDAKYVEIIHTNAGSSGLAAATGDSDFYPNGGKSQPGCGATDLGCSHNRAWEYYAESIDGNNKFVSQECYDYDQYTTDECTGSTTLMGGFTVDRTVYGKYYLKTNSESPYGRG